MVEPRLVTVSNSMASDFMHWKRYSISAPSGFIHLEGMKLGTEGVQMVNNRDKIDPVLLKSIDHAGLKIEDMGEEQFKKVEEIALENGILGGQSSEKKKRIMSKPSNLPPSPKPPTHRLPTRVRQPPSSRPLLDSIAASLFVLNWLSWHIVSVSIRWQDPNNNTDTETRCLF